MSFMGEVSFLAPAHPGASTVIVNSAV
jgi:hypothetical protein